MSQPPTPPEQIRSRLAAAKARGVEDFDLAWRAAFQRVRYADKGSRQDWRVALRATRPEWERAYRGEPTGVGDSFKTVALQPSEIEKELLIHPARTAPVDRISATPGTREQERAAFVK